MKIARAAAFAVLLFAAPVSADEAPAAEDFAVRGCTVLGSGEDVISDGVVVVQDGKITAVGPREGTEIPGGVTVIEAQGKFVTPGFVHVSSRLGLRGSGGGGTTSTDPVKTAADELNPWRDENRWAAANGFTTLGLSPGRGFVGGRGVAVRAAAADLESMVRREDAFLRVDVSPGDRFTKTLESQLSAARKDLDTLAKWERDHAKWEKDKAAAEKDKKKPPTEPKKPSLSESRDAYRKVLTGETALLCNVTGTAGIGALANALRNEKVRGEKLRLYTVLSGDAFRGASELADLGAVCVVRARLTSWPNTLDTVCPAVVLRSAGLRVVLLPLDDKRDGLRSFRNSLSVVVEAGFPREAALRAATHDAAELLGLADEVGGIEKGRRADLLLFSGDPFLATTRLERVWIDGEALEETP